MRKLASNLPLQDMIRSVVANATEKLAADESAQQRQESAYTKPEAITKTASASVDDNYIEKLASAVDYIAANIDQIESEPTGVIAQALAKMAEEGSPAGAGKGPGALEVSKSIGGQQKYKKDKPKTEDAAASQASKPLSAAGKPGGATQVDNNMHDAPGGGGLKPTGKYPADGVLHAGKSKTAADIAKAHVLRKLAGEDVMKANISSSRSADATVGGGELSVTEAGQKSPSQAGDAGSGFGNQGRKHIGSNSAAINYTKGDAKGPQKTQLKEVLEEPALSPSTDSKLRENLRNAGSAGVKIAAARAALQKIAQEGCKCDGKGECAYCQMKAAVRAKTEKTANAMMGYGGGGGAMMGGAPPPQMPTGGGMASMATAGASADGCQCGGTGECRVCKLKAALAAAKAPMNGAPVEKDSTGDTMPPSGMY